MTSVLLNSGWDNKIPQAGWLTNAKSLFLMILEARSPRSGYQHGLARALSGLKTAYLSLYPHMAERELALWTLLMKALIPIMRAPTS